MFQPHLAGLRQGEALEVAQYHHRPQLPGQAGHRVPQGKGVVVRGGGLRGMGEGGLPPAAAQLIGAGVQQDPGEPGGEKLGLAQAAAGQQAPVDRLVHRVQGGGLASQIEQGGALLPQFCFTY